MGKNSELWRYWSIFLDKIMPVVINFTQSFRDVDQELHLPAIRTAMPLIFAFGRINIVAGFLCMKLKTNFPILHEAFSRGDFVVHHTEHKGSGVPMDQTLGKE